jgi:hypothetical protein
MLALALLPSLAAASPQLGERVEATLHLWKTGGDGRTWSSASAGPELEPGGPAEVAYLGVGGVDSSGKPFPCELQSVSCGTLPGGLDTVLNAPNLRESAKVWAASLRLVSIEGTTVRLSVTWRRWESDGAGGHRMALEDMRPVVFDADERSFPFHVLDFVRQPPTPDDSCEATQAVIGISLAVKEDPALANARISYQLWHEHVDAHGEKTVRRVELAGKQGERLDLRFEPMRWPVPRQDAQEFEHVLELLGSVQGRARRDGGIDVAVHVHRWEDVEKRGEPRRGGIGDQGKKVFTMRDGETVSMVLPADFAGRHGMSEEAGFSARGAMAHGEERFAGLEVDSRPFYEGATDTVTLTARRLN